MKFRTIVLRSLVFSMILLIQTVLWAQVGENSKRNIRIGSLQSNFHAYGHERYWNNIYYEGMIWPADYKTQDNAVIQRCWIAVKDFVDSTGYKWSYWGTNMAKNRVKNSTYPMVLKQIAKFEPPTVYVDSENITAPYANEVDEIDPSILPDRIVINVVNTSIGLTMTRKIMAFSQQYHDNYFIKEITFKNTGNVDYDDAIELSETLHGVRVSWSTGYSVCREGANKTSNAQLYGRHNWVTVRGETYTDHYREVLTEDTPISEQDWLRCGFAWFGQAEEVSYNCIGAPDMEADGHLCSPQHAGTIVIHVDKNCLDHSDDPNQLAALGWHGDVLPDIGELTHDDIPMMTQQYDFNSGHSWPEPTFGGTSRMDEVFMTSITDRTDPYTIHTNVGGTNVWICYGPWDIAPGDSITIVEAEGVNGLSRAMCREIGRRWKQAYDNPTDNGPFVLPDGSTTDDKDVFKNAWVFTGKDSIIKTFSRAKRNYDMGYQIPQAPQPPIEFTVTSGGDRILLDWKPSPSEMESDFAGYKIYRSEGRTDTIFQKIADVTKGVCNYADLTPKRGVSYYYYISAYNDGSNNTAGIANPRGSLQSSRFYTKTNKPAFLRRAAGRALEDIRLVPNPFFIRNKDYQYSGEVDKIMFLNIPAVCIIRIYTERGDLIKSIHHVNGSGDEAWSSITSSRQVVCSGIYIVHFEVLEDQYDGETGDIFYRKGDMAIRKLIIIR